MFSEFGIKYKSVINYSLLKLNKTTDVSMRIIPTKGYIPRTSPRKATLKTVADIGSTMPRADAVPTGRVLNDNV